MRLLPALLLALLAVASGPVAPAGGQPLSWVELRADSVVVAFPAPGWVEMTAHYTIINNLDVDTEIVSEVAFALDGVVFDVQPIDVTRSLNECRVFQTPQECTGDCYLSTYPPAVIGECVWYFNVQPDTVPEGCFCSFKSEVRSTIPYANQGVASAALDPGGLIPEPIEENNVASLVFGPVPAQATTWGRLKVLYR